MNLRNWRENLSKVIKLGNSVVVVIPATIRNDMGLQEGDYLFSKYDDKRKVIAFARTDEEGEKLVR